VQVGSPPVWLKQRNPSLTRGRSAYYGFSGLVRRFATSYTLEMYIRNARDLYNAGHSRSNTIFPRYLLLLVDIHFHEDDATCRGMRAGELTGTAQCVFMHEKCPGIPIDRCNLFTRRTPVGVEINDNILCDVGERL